jgi:hypothetical protein
MLTTPTSGVVADGAGAAFFWLQPATMIPPSNAATVISLALDMLVINTSSR